MQRLPPLWSNGETPLLSPVLQLSLANPVPVEHSKQVGSVFSIRGKL